MSIPNSIQPGLSDRIAEAVTKSYFEEVPPDVLRYAKYCIADALGIGFASHCYPFSASAINGIRALKSFGDASIVGTPDRLSVRDSALLNGILIHGLDYETLIWDQSFIVQRARLQ